MSKVYKDTVGLVIEINMQEDISDATKMDILVLKGEGSTATWSGSVYNDNYIRYITEEDDLDEVGRYYLQPDIEVTDWSGMGETVSFVVYDEWR